LKTAGSCCHEPPPYSSRHRQRGLRGCRQAEESGNDATDIAAKLTECGFTVATHLDCSHQEMNQALKDFKRALKDSDVGLFFFAGHGMQVDGSNYLAGVDTVRAD
jgi:uncharacterized caspase-like protein